MRSSRVLTGLTLVAIGGLLWLAFQEHIWARNLVGEASPLIILAVAFCTVMVVTDREDVAGKIGILVGVGLLLMARLGLAPESTLRTLGPLAFALVGAMIILSGLWLRARLIDELAATGTEARSRGVTREYAQPRHHAFVGRRSGHQQARAS